MGDKDEQYLSIPHTITLGKHNIEFYLNDSLSRLLSAQYVNYSANLRMINHYYF